jgi:outer membrane receptor protein involved in Fe transport
LLGLNGLTEIKNAAQARIRGLESDLTWAATYNLRLSGGIAVYNAELTDNYCGFTDDNGVPVTVCDEPEAPSGTRLPISAKFKGNVSARYSWDGEMEPFFMATVSQEGKRESDLRLETRAILGDLPAYTTLDLSAGFNWNTWNIDVFLKNATDERAQFSRSVQCPESVCGEQRYISTNQPRTLGIRVSQEI